MNRLTEAGQQLILGIFGWLETVFTRSLANTVNKCQIERYLKKTRKLFVSSTETHPFNELFENSH